MWEFFSHSLYLIDNQQHILEYSSHKNSFFDAVDR